ncbi:MAG TPA: hypothetical protein VFE16_07525 [Candidatus Cybelea sp.]|jgi:hypothetical protein|nr:hypothetical protein [Candidatus Cybelea sp.]
MNENKGANEGGNGQDEPPSPPALKPTKPHEEHVARNTRHRQEQHPDQKPTWTDQVQAWSAALIFAATVVNVFTTCSIRNITQQYTTYTKAQASAEAISAKAAKSEATAAATEAADETISANAARDAAAIAGAALAGQTTQGKTEAFHFSQQLRRLDASNAAQLKVANATRDSARVAKGALATSQREFAIAQRPWLGVALQNESHPTAPVTYDNGTLRLEVWLKNAGKSPANEVVSVSRVRWGEPAMREMDSFFRGLTTYPTRQGIRFIVLPGDTDSTDVTWQLSENVWKWASTNDGILYTAMRVWYQDNLRRQYSVDWCMIWLPIKSAWMACPRHNEQHEPKN